MAIQSTSKRPVIHVPAALHPLTTKHFGLFWAGAFLSNVGFWIQAVAQGWQVLLLTNSAFLLGLVSFVSLFPNLVLSLFGGVIADKFSRRYLLITTQTIYMCTAILPGVLTTLHVITVWHIILIALVNGIFSAIGFPAWQAFVSDLAPDGELKQSIALNSMQFNLSRVVGPAIGGISIGIFGIAGSYYMNGISYLAVIIPLIMMRPGQRHYLKTEKQSVWRNLGESLLYVKQRPMLQVVLGLQLFIAFFVFPYSTLLPVFAGNIFRTGATGLGVMNAVAGIGALLGAVLLVVLTARLRQPVQVLLLLCLLGGGACIIFAFMPRQAFALPLLLLLGMSGVMATTLANTTIQSSTPEELRGRVISVWVTIAFGVAPFGSLLVGSIAQVWGTRATLAVSGLLCVALAASLVVLTKGVLQSAHKTYRRQACSCQ